MTKLINRLKALLTSDQRRKLKTVRSSRAYRYRPCLEVLEDRLALSTLELSGSFNMQTLSGAVGADLASIQGHDNAWILSLSDVSYSCDEWSEYVDGGTAYHHVRGVHAPSFQFTFTGPDADLLNTQVAQHFMQGGLTGGAYFEYDNVHWADRTGDDSWGEWYLSIIPADRSSGVSFGAYQTYTGYVFSYTVCPPYIPDVLQAQATELRDLRPGNDGALYSFDDTVNVVRDGPPVLTISDVSRVEGRKDKTAFVFTVNLDIGSSQQISVNYTTVDGSARAGSDYEPRAGTLTFEPGETSKTITVWVKGDRKAEPNESFFVRLSAAANAVIEDDVGIGVILNDD